MSQHSSDYETAAADLDEYYGQPILYIDPSLADAIEVTATVHPERTERHKTESGWNAVQVRDIYFDSDAITAKLHGKVTIGTDEYSVSGMGATVGNRTMLTIKRTSAGQISRPRARG